MVSSIKIFTQLQHSDIPPNSGLWWSRTDWNGTYPPQSDSLYTELQQYPHPYRSGSQSSGYSSATLSDCSRPDDSHSLSQSRDFQGKITNNFFIFNSPRTPFSGGHNEIEELNSVCMGIELRYIYYLRTALNHFGAQCEQLISNLFWYEFIVLLTALHTVFSPECV